MILGQETGGALLRKTRHACRSVLMEADGERGHFFLLACLAQKANKYSLARSAWEKYLAIRPLDPKAHHNLGVCLDALGEKAAALSRFEKAFELQPLMADSGSNAAGLLLQAGDAERACALCYRALKGDPDCAAALHNLNTALRMVGRTREAVDFSWRWIQDRLAPGTAVARFAGSTAPGVAGEEGGGARLLTVACVRWGDKYGPEYVERLAAGVRRHLRRSHRFICYTDDVEALKGKAGIVAIPLGTEGGEWRGWWHKAFLFSKEAGLAGRILYLDLDTVVTGSLDDLAGYSGPFAALSVEEMTNEQRRTGLNSSVMCWDADREAAAVQPIHDLLKDAYEVVTGCIHKLDHWLEMVLPGAAALQRVFQGQIVEYKSLRAAAMGDGVDAWSKKKLRSPRGARIVCFPLEPKPHQVGEDWLQQMWRGDVGGDPGSVDLCVN